MFFSSNNASALSTSDLKQTLIVDPGVEQVLTVEFTNNTNQVRSFIPEVDSFIVDEQSGFPLFDQESIAERWIRPIEDQVVLGANETAIIEFEVSVPESAQPTAYHLGLFLREVPRDGQVAVGARVGSLLFLQVAGIQTESLASTKFSPQRSPIFTGSANVETRIQNKGTVAVIPIGTITVTDMFGSIVKEVQYNAEAREVFVGMGTQKVISLDDIGMRHAGPLIVTMFLTYGATGQTISDTTLIWFIPWELLLVFSVICITVFFLPFYIRSKKKKENSIKEGNV